jgi:hypothetical protein
MEAYFAKNRIFKTVGSIILLLYSIFEFHRSYEFFGTNSKARAFGILADAVIFLSASLYILINVSRASKKHKEENAEVKPDSDKNASK